MAAELREELAESMKKEITGEISKEITEKVSKEVTEKVSKEVKAQDMKIVIDTFQEYHDTKENAVEKLCRKFPEYAHQAEELVEKYWKE